MLNKEPSVEEIVDSVYTPGDYEEVVFCGYGEPLLRLETVMEASKKLKDKGAKRIRVNTNGQGNLIHKRNIVPELARFVDSISISLNVYNTKLYTKICNPKFGEEAFRAVLDFILECKKYIPNVSCTAVDLPNLDVNPCEKIAKDLGIRFRKRGYEMVG
jgi:TatD DNase family protein